jgi:predicted AAA+ superfamily ATPase
MIANNDPEAFLQNHKLPILIDEIQRCPKLFGYIKSMVDDNRMKDKENSNGLFYLTGSESIQLIDCATDTLPGIALIFKMNTLSNTEIYNYNSQNLFNVDLERKTIDYTKTKIFERIYRGSYPEL